MCAENVKRKHSKIAFVTIPVLLLAATVAISVIVSENAFARNERYGGSDTSSQAAAVDNTCLNPIFDSNEDIDNAVGVGNCAGTVSQQDESGSASAPITSQTANPTLELQRATTTQPGLGAPTPIDNCVACFGFSEDQEGQFLTVLLLMTDVQYDNLENVCDSLINQDSMFPLELSDIEDVLGPGVGGVQGMNLPQATITQIIQCLENVLGMSME